MELIHKYASEARTPNAQSKVYKDEDAYSFHTTESEGGLYISLNNWIAYGLKSLKTYQHKSGHHLYLNIRRIKKEHMSASVPDTSDSSAVQEPPKKKPTVLGIGVEGGFGIGGQVEYEDIYALYCTDNDEHIPLPNAALPDQVQRSIQGIIECTSASKQQDVQAWVPEKLRVSKHAEGLLQLADTAKVPPSGWLCAMPDCSRNTENLWLNLTDGYIGCGRQNFDGTGGLGHAIRHYEATQFPLAVKLGTITPEGTADVYSYPEDDMVEDPHLERHLAHFGINLAEMRKTEKTLDEMNVDLNLAYEWSRIQEKGKLLQDLFGPGLTGIENLGNSCYMSSVLQVVFSLPAFQERFFKQHQQILEAAREPATDLEAQLAKLAHGLLSGEYSVPEAKGKAAVHEDKAKTDKEGAEPSQIGIAPKMLKHLIGQGHPEFGTMRQQDALEFFQHLIVLVDRLERARGHTASPCETFAFELEDRLLDTASGMVRYATRTDNVVSVPIPLDQAINKKK